MSDYEQGVEDLLMGARLVSETHTGVGVRILLKA